jgi:hypothetical protein
MIYSKMLRFFCTAAIVAGFSTLAHAQATRTWVSGVGDDANPCSRTAPCKTFAGAISKTAAGGEIDALDPGGFGAVTITKAITIDGGGGQVASVLVAGTNGIVIVTGASDDVIIRNVRLQGISDSINPGLNGISFTSGKSLTVEHCDIQNFGNSGINFAPNSGLAALHVAESSITNTNGGSVSFGGILVKPTGGASANVEINAVQFAANVNGVFADGTGGGGAMNINVRDSAVSNSSNCGIVAASNGPAVQVTVDHTEVLFSASIGIAASGGAATVRIGNSTVAHNVTGISALNGSTIQSFKNNQIASNLSDGTPIAAVPGGPLN